MNLLFVHGRDEDLLKLRGRRVVRYATDRRKPSLHQRPNNLPTGFNEKEDELLLGCLVRLHSPESMAVAALGVNEAGICRNRFGKCL